MKENGVGDVPIAGKNCRTTTMTPMTDLRFGSVQTAVQKWTEVVTMPKYIKQEDAVKAVMAAKWVNGSDGAMAMEIVASSSIIDVTRCKNCAHYDLGVCLKIYSDGNAHPEARQPRRPEDFCSYGRRKVYQAIRH